MFLSALSGWHKWYRLRDAGHCRFIDLGGSVRKRGSEEQIKSTDPETWRMVFGDTGDEGSLRIVIDLTSAFFNRFLRWWPSPVLEILTKRSRRSSTCRHASGPG
jgi:hypothetical protein